MFKHYCIIAFRNLIKYKTYSIINVFGLAIGIACSILVFLYVQDELSYDSFHNNTDRIFRVNLVSKAPSGKVKYMAGQPLPLAKSLKATFPEIEHVTRFIEGTAVVQSSTHDATKEKVLFTDSDIFHIFSFPLSQGRIETALAEKNDIIISEAMAQRFFGDEVSLGRILTLNFGNSIQDFIVSGVAGKIPGNSSIQFDFLVRFEHSPNYNKLSTSWTSWAAITYIKIADSAHQIDLQDKLKLFTKNNYLDMIRTWQILGWINEDEDALKLQLQPLQSVHLDPTVEGGLLTASSPVYAYILTGIGLIVLLIACINFTTLSIGRAESRTMEVGLRKTLGAIKTQLMRQFWGEAILFSLLALLTGIMLVEVFLPVFNTLANKSLFINYLNGWQTPVLFLSLVLFTSMTAGGYPALFLYQYKPIDSLKNRNLFRGRFNLNRSLIVVQFTLSVLLIICTMVMSDQINWLKSRNPGFDKEQVVVIPTNTKDQEGEKLLSLYKEELKGQKNIIGITGNSGGFNKEPGWVSYGSQDGTYWKVNIMRVDEDFVKTFDMEILQGRDFSKEIVSDATSAIVVNEALVKEFDWQNPVGKVFQNFNLLNLKEPEIIGVIKDFNYASLHENVKPLAMVLEPDEAIKYIFVKLSPGAISQSLVLLRENWFEIAPGKLFGYYFLDEDFDMQYRSEQRWLQIVSYAAWFAIIIACIGLFGLSALMVSKRTKEIGIRKVLGASISEIIRLLTGEFAMLVLVANLIAWPLAWFAMNNWLQNFAYRIEIGLSLFILAGALVLIISFLTVSSQAIRAALANPVDTLKYE